MPITPEQAVQSVIANKAQRSKQLAAEKKIMYDLFKDRKKVEAQLLAQTAAINKVTLNKKVFADIQSKPKRYLNAHRPRSGKSSGRRQKSESEAVSPCTPTRTTCPAAMVDPVRLADTVVMAVGKPRNPIRFN